MSVGFSVNLKMNIIGQNYVDGIILKYSEVEHVYSSREIKHSIFRNVLQEMWPEIQSFQLASMCDVSGGTGLGSSSAFTVALLNIINTIQSLHLSKSELCYQACKAEIEWCGRRIGLQDQFHSGYGGMNKFTFRGMEPPVHQHVHYNHDWCDLKKSPFILIRAGGTEHDSSLQLSTASAYVNEYENMTSLVQPAIDAITNNDIVELAQIVGESWLVKKRTMDSPFNNTVDRIIATARSVDPRINGKLLGSGGGGFVLLITKYPELVLNLFKGQSIPVSIDPLGTTARVIT